MAIMIPYHRISSEPMVNTTGFTLTLSTYPLRFISRRNTINKNLGIRQSHVLRYP